MVTGSLQHIDVDGAEAALVVLEAVVVERQSLPSESIECFAERISAPLAVEIEQNGTGQRGGLIVAILGGDLANLAAVAFAVVGDLDMCQAGPLQGSQDDALGDGQALASPPGIGLVFSQPVW
jgi:hypothetical protein